MVNIALGLLQTIALILPSIGYCGMVPCVIYVDQNSEGGDGRTWQTAYRELHEVLSQQSSIIGPVEIRVAQGVYKVGRPFPYDYPGFWVCDKMVVKGGYAGLQGQDPNARDIIKYRTILTGDYNGDDLSMRKRHFTFAEGNRQENAQRVVRCYGAAEGTVLDGIIITGGCYRGTGEGQTGGAGMVIFRSRVSLVDCKFIENYSYTVGSAVAIYDSNVTFTRCSFIGNHQAAHGAMWIASYATSGSSNVRLIDCDFIGNYTQYFGGVAIAVDNTGMCGPTTIWASNCRFIANWIDIGEGRDSVISIGGPNSRSIFTNCLFTGNRNDKTSCFSYPRPGYTELRNCIFWGNDGPVGMIDWEYVKVPFSLVQGGWLGVAYIPNTGIIDVDPLFARPGYWDPNGTPDDPYDDIWVDGDYHLKSQAGRWDPVSQAWVKDDVTSPCIDAGDPNSPIGLEPFPNGGRINMGAYGGTAEASKSYFGGPPCETIVSGDIDGDCKVDLQDLAILASHWLEGW